MGKRPYYSNFVFQKRYHLISSKSYQERTDTGAKISNLKPLITDTITPTFVFLDTVFAKPEHIFDALRGYAEQNTHFQHSYPEIRTLLVNKARLSPLEVSAK